MYVRIVTFRLAALTAAEYEAHAHHVAGIFTTWPGLLAKVWLADHDRQVFGGIYHFASREDAEASRHTEVFRAMTDDPAFEDLTVSEYDVLDGPTRITGALPCA